MFLIPCVIFPLSLIKALSKKKEKKKEDKWVEKHWEIAAVLFL